MSESFMAAVKDEYLYADSMGWGRLFSYFPMDYTMKLQI